MDEDGTLSWLFGDHLGSTNITANSGGTKIAELRYKAWGEERYSSGTTPTTFQFTGQRVENDLGFYFYRARWYDPELGRFMQADSIVPGAGNTIALDRYAYVYNNPLKYIDPSGLYICEDAYGDCAPGDSGNPLPGQPDSGGGESGALQTTNSTLAMLPTVFPYSSQESFNQAIGLVRDWFLQTGDESQYFGPWESLTIDIMSDPEMDKFRAAWAESGYQLPFAWEHTIDNRVSGSTFERVLRGFYIFFREHVIQLGLAAAGIRSNTPEGAIDAVGGTIGSFDLITATKAGNGVVRIQVGNTMGWESLFRIYGTNSSFGTNRPRSGSVVGGNTYQVFYWWETYP